MKIYFNVFGIYAIKYSIFQYIYLVYGCAYSYLDIELKLIVFLKMNDSDYNNSLFIIQTAIYTQ